MRNNSYLVIWTTSDDMFTVHLTEEEILGRLNDPDDNWGELRFLDKMPDKNVEQWPTNSMLIIRGDIVVPKPKQVVTEYEL
jgi:hypothetical protein